MSQRTRVKICCIASIEEAALAISAGADAIGLVGRMPGGPGPIPDETIREIARRIPPPIATFLLTSETEPDAVVNHVRRTGIGVVQLVDDTVEPGVYRALRAAQRSIRVVQVIHVCGDHAIDAARAAAEHVDALLLDSGNPKALVLAELGGTGRVHDWSISRQLVERVNVPVFLAGGLNAGNVASAIKAVAPFAVDVCSGVRTDGKLDPDKLHAFFAASTQARVAAT